MPADTYTSDLGVPPTQGDGQNDIARAWAVAEMMPWIAGRSKCERVAETLLAAHRKHPSFVLFRTVGAAVESVAKSRTLAHIADGRSTSERTYSEFLSIRERAYRSFLQKVFDKENDSNGIVLGVGIDDLGLQGKHNPPNFAFQKIADSDTMLLPDIDLIVTNFMSDSNLRDPFSYEEKSNSAIFCGSTTGARYTMEVLRNLSAPRLEAAVYFKKHPLVQFLLPRLAQCDSEETREALRAMGFGDGVEIPWKEQYRHKFLISMDGNGATCSRVALALRSNSVLLKYDSSNMLYYFRGLVPWVHYIPIHNHNEIEEIINSEAKSPGLFRCIAENGRRFAERFLNEKSAIDYTAHLLKLYLGQFGEISVNEPTSSADRFNLATVASECGGQGAVARHVPIIAHISGRGDVRFEPGVTVGETRDDARIEGFALEPEGGKSLPDVRYRATLADGSAIPWVQCPDFCGTRGQNLPLVAFAAKTVGKLAEYWACEYSGIFVDGSCVGPLRHGLPCKAPSGAPLKSFQLMFVPSETAESRCILGVQASAWDDRSRQVVREFQRKHIQAADKLLLAARRMLGGNEDIEVGDILEQFIYGAGGYYDSTRWHLRQAVDELGRASGVLLSDESFFEWGLVPKASAVASHCPGALDLLYKTRDNRDLEVHEVLDASRNEWMDLRLHSPIGNGIRRPDRPAFRIYATNDARVYLHPLQYQVLSRSGSDMWLSGSPRGLTRASVPHVAIEKIEKNIIIAQDRFEFSNLCHFIFDGVTRILHYAERFGVSKNDLFVLGAFPFEYHAVVLEALRELVGVERENVLFSAGPRLLVTSKKCFWFSDQVEAVIPPAQMAHPSSVRMLSALCAKLPGAEVSARRAYISRADAGLRRVFNENRVLEVLRKEGFATFELSKMSAAEQVGVFRAADVVVGPHGMGLTHVIVAPPEEAPHRQLIELHHPSRATDAYAFIARALGMDYQPIFGREVPGTPHDFEIDLENIMEHIR